MAEQSGDKSQDATPHRRQQAREKGQVAQSQDLGSAALLVSAVLVLMMIGPRLMGFFAGLLRGQLGGDAWLTIDRNFVLERWTAIGSDATSAVLPILGLMFLTGVAVNLAQVGILFVPERLLPDSSRINPLSGFKRIFSLTGFMRLTFGMFKVLIVSTVALFSLYARQTEIVALAQLNTAQIAVSVSSLVLGTCLKIGIALLILALLDFAYQRWKHEQDLKMTQQEVREEMKNLQGDPQIIARRRAVQRQLVLNRMSDAVPKADVVITNPTELAIAVQYVPEEMAAPIVVAKGAGVLATRIRRLALENSIPIIEKKPLAQALYKQVEVNQPIPGDLYAAVAEVLAYVYQLQGKAMPTADA
jgi:flagellar biosynthetic protein FlhB